MIRRFNYTGRKKIPANRVQIALLNDKNGRFFKASLDLKNFNFPPEARIFIEPNYKGVYQRFSFGTVGKFTEPSDTRLTELPETELVFFDISIIDDTDSTGLILGKAQGIPAGMENSSGNRVPLLFVNSVDLKDQIWKVSFDASDDNRPILEINCKIPELKDLARNDKRFISLVYPSAFRTILMKIVEDEDYDPNPGSWKADWFKFLEGSLGITEYPENENGANSGPDEDSWIDDCVNAFCKKAKMIEKLTEQ